MPLGTILNQYKNNLKINVFPKYDAYFFNKDAHKKEAADLVKEIWTENYGYQYD